MRHAIVNRKTNIIYWEAQKWMILEKEVSAASLETRAENRKFVGCCLAFMQIDIQAIRHGNDACECHEPGTHLEIISVEAEKGL